MVHSAPLAIVSEKINTYALQTRVDTNVKKGMRVNGGNRPNIYKSAFGS